MSWSVRRGKRLLRPRAEDQGEIGYRWSPTPGQIRSIQTLIDNESPNWLMINFTQRAPILDHLSLGRDVRSALIVHDSIADRLKAYRSNGVDTDFEELTAAEVVSFWAKADLVISIQVEEAAFIAKSVPDLKVLATPMPLKNRRLVKPLAGADFVFVGGGSRANVEGASWLIQKVWPLILEKLPEARLHLFGSVCEKLNHAPSGVVFHGKVADVLEAYRLADVALVSLLFGTGLKIKLMEAVSFGVPVVSTSVGAEGLAPDARDSLSIADDPKEFAEACCKLVLYPTLASATVTSQWKSFADHYGEEAALGPLLAELTAGCK